MEKIKIACESCRKKKKKCDSLEPSCLRCSNLRIPCLYPKQKNKINKSIKQIQLNTSLNSSITLNDSSYFFGYSSGFQYLNNPKYLLLSGEVSPPKIVSSINPQQFSHCNTHVEQKGHFSLYKLFVYISCCV